jgi:hypothetical protein
MSNEEISGVSSRCCRRRHTIVRGKERLIQQGSVIQASVILEFPLCAGSVPMDQKGRPQGVCQFQGLRMAEAKKKNLMKLMICDPQLNGAQFNMLSL